MKHNKKITFILLAMFFVTQLLGLFVIHLYSPQVTQVASENGTMVNITQYNLPYGTNPPQESTPPQFLVSLITAFVIAIVFILILMKFRAELFIRLWFFFVITLALGITINSFIQNVKYSSLIALAIALPLAIIKVFKREIIIHNLTEMLVYPGIASIFVPLLNIWTAVLLLIIISVYDIYAVWHAGFMQKMAKYQIHKVRVFAGFYVPYIGKKEAELIAKTPKSKLKGKKIKVNLGILGGGDVVFPLILAGVVLNTLGLLPALAVSVCATLALAILFYKSEKGKWYPAMPFITAGCLVGLAIAYLI